MNSIGNSRTFIYNCSKGQLFSKYFIEGVVIYSRA